MSGICGWNGQSDQGLDAESILDKMEEHLGVGKPIAHVKGSWGAVAGKGSKVRVAATSEVIVILHGEPTFSVAQSESNIARVLCNAYLQHGAGIMSDIHGQFSLAVLDLRDQSAMLAIDRLGIEPMSYTVSGSILMFASRADCLSMHPHASSEIDPQSIFNYLYFHCVPSPRSIYRHQQKLLPGQIVRFRNGQVDASFYWQLKYHDEEASFEPLSKECFSLLEQSVRNAAGDDNPGAFLSGGIDSSTVSGLLGRYSSTTSTYTIGFEAQGYDEMAYARLTAKHFNLKHIEYYVTPQDVVDAIPLVAQAYDEPFGNASAVPAYYCAKLAANDGQSVLLAGDGGDEIFAGNERYAHQLLLEQYQKVPAFLRHTLIEPLAFKFPGHDRITPIRKLGSYINQAKAPLPDRMETYNFLNRTSLAEIFSSEFIGQINPDEPLMNLRETYFSAITTSPLNRMLHLDLKITLADSDLRKVNRMCELAGIEVRYPMLSDELVEFSGRVPPSLKLRHMKLRYFLKRTLKDFLPKEVLTKSKQGFGLPFGIWMREHEGLRGIAFDSLESFKARGYVNASYIDMLLQRHKSEHASYYGVMIWVMMMLEQWLQTHEL